MEADTHAPTVEDTVTETVAEKIESSADVQDSADACAEEQGMETSGAGPKAIPGAAAAATSPDAAAQAADVKLEREAATPSVEDTPAEETVGQQAEEPGDLKAQHSGPSKTCGHWGWSRGLFGPVRV